MTADNAHAAVSLSAFWVAGIFAYRKLTASSTPAPNTAHFVIGFGFIYVVLATVAEFAPELAGMFAVLIATGDTLANGQAIFNEITQTVGGKAATGMTFTTAQLQAAATEQSEQPEQALQPA